MPAIIKRAFKRRRVKFIANNGPSLIQRNFSHQLFAFVVLSKPNIRKQKNTQSDKQIGDTVLQPCDTSLFEQLFAIFSLLSTDALKFVNFLCTFVIFFAEKEKYNYAVM